MNIWKKSGNSWIVNEDSAFKALLKAARNGDLTEVQTLIPIIKNGKNAEYLKLLDELSRAAHNEDLKEVETLILKGVPSSRPEITEERNPLPLPNPVTEPSSRESIIYNYKRIRNSELTLLLKEAKEFIGELPRKRNHR